MEENRNKQEMLTDVQNIVDKHEALKKEIDTTFEAVIEPMLKKLEGLETEYLELIKKIKGA